MVSHLATGPTPMNKNMGKQLLLIRKLSLSNAFIFVLFCAVTAHASDSSFPNLLIKGQNLSFQCSNGLRFFLYPDSGNSTYRQSFQNLSVMIKIGDERRFLVGQQYAYNRILEERQNWGLNVSFSGKTGEVSISRGEGTQFKQLGRYCKRIK